MTVMLMEKCYRPTWAIQTNFVDQAQARSVAFSAKLAGCQVISVNVLSDSLNFSETVSSDTIIVPYGSTKLVKMLAGKSAGVFFNDAFSVSSWNANRHDMLNSNSKLVLVSNILSVVQGIPQDVKFFVRPAIETKVFNGGLFRVDELLSWAKCPPKSAKHDTIVALNEEIEIDAEWRWFVVNGKVIDGSIYKLRNQRVTLHEENPSVIEEAQHFANKWLPMKTRVMDLAQTSNGIKVVEFNCLNSSGFYNHDINKIVRSVAEYLMT